MLISVRGAMTLAQRLDQEFTRVAKEEDRSMGELVDEIATLTGRSPRQLYNFRNGKWPIPSDLIPILCRRFGSRALIDALIEDLARTDIPVPEDYDLVHMLVSSLRSLLAHYERYFAMFDSGGIDEDDIEQMKASSSEIVTAIYRLNGIAESAVARRKKIANR
jgi:hypothetical protein